MSSFSKSDDKEGSQHVEIASSSAKVLSSETLEDLDSIEQTQASKYAWLVAITAGVGGMLFGKSMTSKPIP